MMLHFPVLINPNTGDQMGHIFDQTQVVGPRMLDQATETALGYVQILADSRCELAMD